MNLALARLALRRSLPRSLLIAVAALLVLATQIDWAPPSEWSAAAGVDAAAFAREGIWTLAVLALAPLLVHACASTVGRWRGGEVDWLAKSPLSRGAILLSTWAGSAAAAVIAAAAIALVAELGARDLGPTYSVEGRAPTPHAALVDPATPLRWTVAQTPALGPGARARLGVELVAGGPAADVRLTLTRRASDGSIRRATAARHVTSASAIDVELPGGDGPLELELAREGEGAIVALDGDGVAWLARRPSAAWISVDLALNLALALAAWCALALGLGAWVSGAIATALVATIALASWLADAPALDAWSPWARLPSALDLAGRGLALAPVTWTTFVGAIACVAGGLALARIDLATWRRAA